MLRRIAINSNGGSSRHFSYLKVSSIRSTSFWNVLHTVSRHFSVDSSGAVPTSAAPRAGDEKADVQSNDFVARANEIPPPPPLTPDPADAKRRIPIPEGVKIAWRPTDSSATVNREAATISAKAALEGGRRVTGTMQAGTNPTSGMGSAGSYAQGAGPVPPVASSMNSRRIASFQNAFTGSGAGATADGTDRGRGRGEGGGGAVSFDTSAGSGGLHTNKNGSRHSAGGGSWSGSGGSGGGAHIERTEEDIRADIKRDIWKGDMQKNPDKILLAAQEAQKKSIQLDVKEYFSILWACEQLPGDDIRGELAFWVYFQIKQRGADIPAEAYSRVAAVCAKRGDTSMALGVLKDVDDRNLVMTEKFMSSTVYAVASDHRSDVKALNEIYSKYTKMAVASRWVGPASMYTQVAAAYGRLHCPADVLRVLKQMTEAGHEPSINLCTHLLEYCLRYGNTHLELLRVLSKWYLQNFQARLDRGVLDRMLQIAGSESDDVLAQTVVQLLIRAGYTTGPADYACWLRACSAKKDLVGCVEALISAQTQNVDVLTPTDTWAGGLDMQLDIAMYLSQSIGMMDNVYFALVDLVKGDYKVPPLMLNAIVMASGQVGQLDRSFATFQEITSLFGCKHDTNSYNALLWANAKELMRNESREDKIQVLLNLLQRMEEEEGCAPNGYTFEILLTFLAEAFMHEHHHQMPSDRRERQIFRYNQKDPVLDPIPGLDGIIDHIIANNMKIKSRSLRQLARTVAGSGDIALTRRVVQLVVDTMGRVNVPKFFKEQMKVYRIDIDLIEKADGSAGAGASASAASNAGSGSGTPVREHSSGVAGAAAEGGGNGDGGACIPLGAKA